MADGRSREWLDALRHLEPSSDADEFLRELPAAACACRALVLEAVKLQGFALKHAADHLQQDEEVVSAAVRTSLIIGENWFPVSMRANRTVVEAAIQSHGPSIRDIADSLKYEVPLVISAFCGHNGVRIPGLHATMPIWDLWVAIVADHPRRLDWAPELMRSDRDFLLAVVKRNGRVLQFASREFRADRALALAAVAEFGAALEALPEEFRADREIVICAVRQDAALLRFAAESLQSDPELQLVVMDSHTGKRSPVRTITNAPEINPLSPLRAAQRPS